LEQIDGKIMLFLSTVDNASMKEIQTHLKDVNPRTVLRHVKDLHNSGTLEHKKIRGKGKHLRYSILEEDFKSDHPFEVLDTDKNGKFKIDKNGNYKKIAVPITQKNITGLIRQQNKFYHTELKKLVSDKKTQEFIDYHIALIFRTLEEITLLSLSINSGALGYSTSKQRLARENRNRYEEFLKLLIENLYKRDEKRAPNIISTIYKIVMDTHFIQILDSIRLQSQK
jgi:hypothetical protein